MRDQPKWVVSADPVRSTGDLRLSFSPSLINTKMPFSRNSGSLVNSESKRERV
jgi:hypothetical protein